MNQPRYKIVFDGQLMPEASLETVKENLARLFKSDPARIENLFSGAPVALKRDLDDGEALQYLNALQKAGAKVRKELDQAASLSLVPTEDEAEQTVDAATPHMTCPKCGHEQAKASECSACGIIIEKYLARQAQLAEAAPAPAPLAPAASPYAPPQANVAEQLPQYSELKVFSVSGRIGRVRYLGWTMAMLLCMLPLMLLFAGGSAISSILGTLMLVIAVIAMLAVGVFIGVQRLHDMDWSGWLWLLNFVPVIGSVFALLMLIIPGTQGVNRYGPPPPPNSTGVKILAWLFLLVPLTGIVAAIAIPQYQDYVERAAEFQEQ
ncbi:DUF805 domain-containing protein [Ectopseudomonas alcaliphila]|uniref:DUF805 domain-containing protein n=1 Tax=Ectopseudomonas alcaliphila TaxID=101564 RepID=UPI00278A7B00|nr:MULTISPECIES: DUF805 domain-containing protein [Pseudomonas]MDP9942692.1 uncharacterized membrane protein YhaH (DUF805 family) [Pseudomonas sp. 3400]MDR7014869.1 uncharacterized membrane protein YhaH (DUF805 family) [Pseudomonas alcaliphila]